MENSLRYVFGYNQVELINHLLCGYRHLNTIYYLVFGGLEFLLTLIYILSFFLTILQDSLVGLHKQKGFHVFGGGILKDL